MKINKVIYSFAKHYLLSSMVKKVIVKSERGCKLIQALTWVVIFSKVLLQVIFLSFFRYFFFFLIQMFMLVLIRIQKAYLSSSPLAFLISLDRPFPRQFLPLCFCVTFYLALHPQSFFSVKAFSTYQS